MLYPVMLNVAGKQVVVVGGGSVAARKAAALLEAGAEVTIISPALSAAMNEWLCACSTVQWKKKTFEPADIQGAFLIIAATNQRDVNSYVRQCAADDQLINVADDPKASNFHVPASLKKGNLTIAVSTNGASPGLSKQLIHELSNQYNDEFVRFIDFLEECRQQVKEKVKDPEKRKDILTQLIQPDFYKLLFHAGREERMRLFQTLLD
ncbi:NAD(P)-binding protein [Bacillus xiapuensis]|uniref:NAD(P)-binding protein n=1 Tax=Bacillus xiapuensis TaxID=2014075 RepID=UPI000C239C79|nr:NAD(P)-binding protein [Bacillus xiapuensis]